MNPIIPVPRIVSAGRMQTAWSLCKSQKAPTDWAHLSKLPSMEPWLRGDCSVLSLSGMEQRDELSHLIKGVPAWRITAQDVQNLPALITFLLSAATMDLSPNCMIPIVLNGFIPASPCASSCAAAWHHNARRLQAAPGHHNTILLLMELCCIMACDEYPGGKKFKLILLPSQPLLK